MTEIKSEDAPVTVPGIVRPRGRPKGPGKKIGALAHYKNATIRVHGPSHDKVIERLRMRGVSLSSFIHEIYNQFLDGKIVVE